MSYDAMDWTFTLKGLDAKQYAVLRSLAHHANKNHECYPSTRRIAIQTGLSTRSVTRALSELEELGLVRRVPRFSGSRQTSNLYRVNVGATPAAEGSAAESSSTETHGRPRLSHDVTLPPAIVTGHEQESRNRSGSNRLERNSADLPESSRRPPSAAEVLARERQTLAEAQMVEQSLRLVRHADQARPSTGPRVPTAEGGSGKTEASTSASRATAEQQSWKGHAASLDDGGWGLDSSGHPLPAVTAASKEQMDAYYAAKIRLDKRRRLKAQSDPAHAIAGTRRDTAR